MSQYLFNGEAVTQDDPETQRLALVERVSDPSTWGHLTRLGIAPGERCLEVGAGGGSIARWLADRVGPTGLVCATDLETSRLVGMAEWVEVLRHDVSVDAIARGRSTSPTPVSC